jgi:hypothetical protein
MCDICNKLGEEHKSKVDSIISSIFQRIENSRYSNEYKGTAFIDSNFLSSLDMEDINEKFKQELKEILINEFNHIWFEPRMQLQLPSNFYQSVIVDDQKLRSDWASGWLRVVSFSGGYMHLLIHALVKKEDKEYNLFTYFLRFKLSELTIEKNDVKIQISIKDAVKEGIDLQSGSRNSHKFSFSFVHQKTENSFVPADRLQSSGLFKSVYAGKVAPKPLTFDWMKYVITVPHFSFYSIIHQRYKEFGFTSPIEMQHAVTGCLKECLNLE